MVVTGHPSWDVSGLILILEKHSGKRMTHGMPDFPEQSVRLVPRGTSSDHRVFLVAGLGLCAVLFNLCPVLSGEGFYSPHLTHAESLGLVALAQSLKTGKKASQDLSPDLPASTGSILSHSAFSFSADKGRLA